jgi:hypothetical protein
MTPLPGPDGELFPAVYDELRRLAERYPEKAELVKLRYPARLTADRVLVALRMSPSTAERHWAFTWAWLRGAMSIPHAAP